MNSNDINKKLQSLLSESKISEQNIKKLLNSPQGRNIVGSLSEKDKEKLINSFMSLSNEEIKRKLKNADLSAFSGLSAEDILKKLR